MVLNDHYHPEAAVNPPTTPVGALLLACCRATGASSPCDRVLKTSGTASDEFGTRSLLFSTDFALDNLADVFAALAFLSAAVSQLVVVNQLTSHSVSQSVSQSASQSVNQSISQ